MASTPTRRSTRVSKPPDRLAPASAHQPHPPSMTPRKRSKDALTAAKEAASAFAMPLVASSSKRQKTGQLKQTTRARRGEADESDNNNSDNDDQSDVGQEDEDDDAISESAEDDSSDDASDFEEEGQRPKLLLSRTPRKSPQRRGGQTKKANQKRGSLATPSGRSRAKNTSGDAAPSTSIQNDGETNQLLGAIIDDDVALAQVVMDWIGAYRENADQAICELVNFFVKLTGCPGSIHEDALYETEGIVSVVEGLQKQSLAALRRHGGAEGSSSAAIAAGGVDIDGGDDLLTGKSKEHRKFRKNALLFLQKLIVDGQHHLIFEDINEESNGLSAFTEAALQWIASMAGSSYRPFRHVATLVALTIQSALVSIRAHISIELQTTHRQLDAEIKRSAASSSARRRPAKDPSARAEQLRLRVATLTEQDELAEAAFMVFYNTVFIYRYRDVNTMIRSECLVPLAAWCRAYPASYLNTEYLRYLGWSLNDKDPRVREAAISAVVGPLLLGKTSHSQGNVGGGVGVFSGVDTISEESFSEGIRPFIVRFLPRLVQIAAGDVDVKVQVAAIKLVAQLGKHGYLDPSAKIGDIRNLNHGSKGAGSMEGNRKAGRGGKKTARGKRRGGGGGKRNARSHQKYSNSLSQQLLEESSSESGESDEEDDDGDGERNGDDSRSTQKSSSNALDINVLYDDDNSGSDDDDGSAMVGLRYSSARGSSTQYDDDDNDDGSRPLRCPRHSTMRYLAPLVAHTHASVRSAASELVAWWIKSEWMVSAQVSALGVDVSLEGGVLSVTAGQGSTDDDAEAANDDVEMSGDAGVSISELLSNPARKRRARKWLLFKSLGAFLYHLSRTSSKRTTSGSTGGDNLSHSQDAEEGVDPEGRKQWVMEQAASCAEEMWATPANHSVGLASGEEQTLALAGSTIRGIAPTALDDEIETALGSDQCAIPPRAVAAAQALWHKIPELSDLSTLSAFLAWDHSALQSRSSAVGNSDTVLSHFALSQSEETALLQAYATWVLENNKAAADKKRRSRNKKDKSELDEEHRAMSSVWQSMFVPLLARNIDSPSRLLPLVFLASEAMDLQVLFDADRIDTLRDAAKNIMLVLERHGEDVRLSRLAIAFLERVDASRMLAPGLTLSADACEDDNADGGYEAQGPAGAAPGDLVCKAARTASSLLVTAAASVPETPSRSHASAYADVYARVVALRSIIRTKDISALLTVPNSGDDIEGTSSEAALEEAEGYADSDDRSLDAPIEQMYALVELAAKTVGLHTIPEKAALAALDVAFHFILWRALKLDTLLKQYPAHPLIASEVGEAELPPFWRRVESAAKNLRKDRDRLVGLCLELSDETMLNYSRVRELAFAVLGRSFRLFTGNIVRDASPSTVGGAATSGSAALQRAREIRRTLALQNGSLVRSRLVAFFESRLSAWETLVGRLSQVVSSESDESATDEGRRQALGWYKEAPSSWSIAYSRFCMIAALWAQWIGDQTVPMGSLTTIAAYTGMLGLEPLEKLRLESLLAKPSGDNDGGERGDMAGGGGGGGSSGAKTAHKRKIGFVALSAFDHIVQAAVEALKPMIVLQSTRDMVMDVYMSALRMSLEKNTAGSDQSLLSSVADTVNTGTLARFVGSALRSAFSQTAIPATPARGRRGAGDAASFALAPAVVGTAWTQHHLRAIDYGLSRVVGASAVGESSNILDDDLVDDVDAAADREPSAADEWETQAGPWFAALAQTVTGVLRPRHAEVLEKHVAARWSKLGITAARAEDRAGDAEAAIAAVAPYQRALDKELAKLDAIKARMAEVRAAEGDAAATPSRSGGARQGSLLLHLDEAGDTASSPPGSPTPAASRVLRGSAIMEVEETAEEAMDVDD
ncbi:cohesin complex subunit [Coemansia sp. RSA 1939]|nr:cohesin complex subunit [Coemansia sp. RSA 1939]